jgi:hypothetical protein
MVDTSNDYQNLAATILVKPGKYGLENKSKNRWSITTSDGAINTKQPGDVVVLSAGVKIDFSNGNIAEVISNN